MPRAKLADSKPRGRISAYAFFVQTCREEHKRKHPDENVVFSEFSRKCAERWKVMHENEKQPFYDLADKDKTRYDSEMLNYQGPKNMRGRRRRQRKDPNAPKRALSAFFWFCSDERPKVRAIYPNLGVGEIAKELGVRWSTVSDEIRSRCEEMAKKDKLRYAEEMKAFKGGNFLPHHRQDNQVNTQYVEEMEDSEDDDDE
ncbi:High mobility group protein DSP1 [Armadillidium nasatum]|uniref:High mobility group protein DSP1 n=1 Tax=Armadillidium nasatum TaxID=96803 RepID=A0A5N5TP18_9CRUS|nr:High mobility group protein DSP1 [Armadillidium nasatum]